MTRIKEPDPTANEIPEYKSPPSRLIKSLRQAYDNARYQRNEKSQKIAALQGKTRDISKSRDEWKARAKRAEAEIQELKKRDV